MTIQKPDFTPSEQALIEQWIDPDIPARIASYQQSLVSLNSSKALWIGIDGIFEKIYSSWVDLHLGGFLSEIRGKGLSTGETFFNPPVLEAEIQSTAANPVSTRLFPAGSISLEPLYAFDLRALPSDFDLTDAYYTGVPPASTPTGYNERAALVAEAAEWALPVIGPPPIRDPNVIRACIYAEEAALLTQLAALNYLDANLSIGQGGKANLAAEIAVVTASLGIVQGHISIFPILPPSGPRVAEIGVRIPQIDFRVSQIISPGTDQNFVRDERYFWLRQRLNLGFGSLTRLASTDRSINFITARIADLQAELVKYGQMGF